MIGSTWPETTSPISLAYAEAVWQAVAERMHASGGGVRDYNFWRDVRFPGAYKALGYDFLVAVRQAITGMIPYYINLDYDYAASDWMDFPQMLTLHDVFSDASRNIALMPSRYDHAFAFAGWLQKAAACLDLMVATPTVVAGGWSTNTSGTWLHPPATMAQTIAAETADAEVNRLTWLRGSHTLDMTWRRWTIGRVWDEGWDAATYQQYALNLPNRSPFAVVPHVVMCHTHDSDNYIFDDFGCGYTLGDNELDPLPGKAIVVVDADTAVLQPTAVIPALEVPDMPYVNSVELGYLLRYYFDWRTDDGFEFYSKEEEEE